MKMRVRGWTLLTKCVIEKRELEEVDKSNILTSEFT